MDIKISNSVGELFMMKQIILLSFLFFLTACGTNWKHSYNVEIARNNIYEMPKKCKLLYPNGNLNSAQDLCIKKEIEYYLLKNDMLDKNYHESPAQGQCLIGIVYGEHQYNTSHTKFIYGQTGISGSTSNTYMTGSAYTYGNRTYGSAMATTRTTYTPTYGITGSYQYHKSHTATKINIFVFKDEEQEKRDKMPMYSMTIIDTDSIFSQSCPNIKVMSCLMDKFWGENYSSTITFKDEEINKILNNDCSSVN